MEAGNKITIGIIGAGMIGDEHLENIRQDGRGEVTWLATNTEETLNKKLKKYGVENGTTEYEELLQDPQLDAVIIAAPPHLHYEMLEKSLNAGKHVLLEKPVAPNREEVRESVQEVYQHPELTVLECSCRHSRLQPKFNFVKNMIETGELGEVYHIHHNNMDRQTFVEYNPAGKWGVKEEKSGGGPFADWGVYDLSFHLGVLDDEPSINEVNSFTRSDLKSLRDFDVQPNVEQHGAAYMQFDSGLTYYYEQGAGVNMEVENETRIYGTRGAIRFGYCSWNPPEIDYYFLDDQEKELHRTINISIPEDHDDDLALIEHFLDCLTGDVESEMSVSLAAKHMDIIFRILGK